MLETTRLSRRTFMAWLGGGLAIAAIPKPIRAAVPAGDLTSFTSKGTALGAQVAITVLHDDPAVARAAADAALEELRLVDSLMSVYRESSQVSLLNRNGALADPHPYVRDILQAAAEMSARSGGAFDITVQPLWQLYSDAKSAGRLPTSSALAEARSKIGHQKVHIGPAGVKFTQPGMSITLNGIAQGFAADRAVAVLKSRGIQHALINAGELAPIGSSAQNRSWTAGIQHPRRADAYAAIARLGDRCLATSGDYATSFTPDYLHNHLFDPATGDSPLELSSASILAPSATLADALSTAVFVLGAHRGMQLIGQYPNVDALLIRKDGTELVTANFSRA